MLKILTQQRKRRINPLMIRESSVVTEVITPERQRQQKVEAFRNRNSYEGKSLIDYSLKLLSELAKIKEISPGAFFISEMRENKQILRFLSAYAAPGPDNIDLILELGEGFPGQVAKEGKLISISDVPQGYLTIESGLGKANPVSLIIFPVKHNDKVLAVIELASFRTFTREDEIFFEEISSSIADQILKLIG